MRGLKITARLNVVAISDEGMALLKDAWPEWREHMRVVEVGAFRIINQDDLLRNVLGVEWDLLCLKHQLATDFVEKCEPEIMREEVWS